jgi:hypothetical protein
MPRTSLALALLLLFAAVLGSACVEVSCFDSCPEERVADQRTVPVAKPTPSFAVASASLAAAPLPRWFGSIGMPRVSANVRQPDALLLRLLI